MPYRMILMTVLLVAGVTAAPGINAQTYDLDTESIAAVGDRYLIEGEARESEDSKQYADGEMFTEESMSIEIELHGEVEVLEVNEDHKVSRLALTPEHCAMSINGREVHLAMDKRVLAIQTAQGVVYEYENGGAVGDEPSLALDMILSNLIKSADADEGPMPAFGIDQPRTPGEAWEMDHDQLSEHFSGSAGVGFQDEDLHSQVRFLAFGQADFGKGLFGEDLAVLEMQTRIAPFTFTGDFFPDFMSLENPSFSITGDLAKSLDPRSRQGWITMSIEMEFRAVGIIPEENVELVVEMQTQQYSMLIVRDVE